MNLIQIYSISSLMEIVFTIVATLCAAYAIFGTFIDVYKTKHRIIKWASVALATVVLVVCIINVCITPSTNVYSYYVTNQTELSQAIDEGYSIYTSDGNVYDLIKEVK